MEYKDTSVEQQIPEDHYEVSHIVNHRGPRHARQYRVRWAGYTAKDDHWISAKDFADITMVEEYENRLAWRKRLQYYLLKQISGCQRHSRQTCLGSKTCLHPLHPLYTFIRASPSSSITCRE